jgi:hypothetical protein
MKENLCPSRPVFPVSTSHLTELAWIKNRYVPSNVHQSNSSGCRCKIKWLNAWNSVRCIIYTAHQALQLIVPVPSYRSKSEYEAPTSTLRKEPQTWSCRQWSNAMLRVLDYIEINKKLCGFVLQPKTNGLLYRVNLAIVQDQTTSMYRFRGPCICYHLNRDWHHVILCTDSTCTTTF